jgi:hypothetical protein
MPSIPERTPADFAEILCGPELPLIVGGQAVNLWAELYAPELAGLDDYRPFVSKDADIYGTRALAKTLAQRAGWKCHFDEKRSSIVVAILTKPWTPERASLTIEVLGEVNGLVEADLATSTVVELGGIDRYRIPPPTVLLKAKLYNLASLFWSERPQDLKHTRMLCEMVPHYLNELHAECLAGKVAEKTFVAAVNYTAGIVTAGYAGNAARSHGLDLRRVVPPSLWLNGPIALQPILARLHAQGLAP